MSNTELIVILLTVSYFCNSFDKLNDSINQFQQQIVGDMANMKEDMIDMKG